MLLELLIYCFLFQKWPTESFIWEENEELKLLEVAPYFLYFQSGCSLISSVPRLVYIIQHCFQFLLGRLLAPLRNVFGGTTKSIMVFLKKDLLIKSKSVFILEDPGADSGGEGKSKRAEKYGSKKSKEKARRAPGDNVLPDQFSTVTAVLASDWCQKTFVFFWTLSWAVTSPRETRLP